MFVEIVVTVIESKLAVFKVELERGFVYISGFSMGPKQLYAVDIRFTSDKFIVAVMDTGILVISKVDEAIVTTPAVRVNDAFNIDVTAYQCL